jgi:hypothetical protein
MRHVSMATRDELVAAIAERYGRSDRSEKGLILDEFVAVTKMHRKHAQRLLRSGKPGMRSGPRPGRRVYDDAVREALIVMWETSDRICGKRLKSLLPLLIDAMERHKHLNLADEVRSRVLSMSAATIDRSLREAREQAGGRRRRRAVSSAVRRSVPVRTFSDWQDPSPGFFEADLVAHSGPRANGSFIQTLVLTDIATGWTECMPLLVREQTLLTEVLSQIRARLPFDVLGFDTDNDSVFMNDTVKDYCIENGIEFTRSRPYRKNDQAWVEQKNGAIVRRIVGYRRFAGLQAAAELNRLYATVRLFVNYFQPSFKLAEKQRDGAQVRKRYHKPATPYQRLLDDPRISQDTRRQVNGIYETLDPVRLLQDIRARQRNLIEIADAPEAQEEDAISAPTIDQFLASLKTAWREGDPNPTAQAKPKVPRSRRRPDPLAAVNQQIESWFASEPWRTAREFLNRLQSDHPERYGDEHLRTLQRRLKVLRRQAAQSLVLGCADQSAASKDVLDPHKMMELALQ